ncbi:MAG: EFR1 family ferrodoxin [Methanomassiliicoccaceae archaeon]|jgi:ferredoxin|nr:EFR1 family ferrodoxin [Methanomassiliicoccaceae archaeon]
MILYFSGTGNSRYVAERLGVMLDLPVVPVTDYKDSKIDASGRPVGIVCPVYFWGIPTLISEFIKKTEFQNFEKIFSVCTYGEGAGNASRMLEKEFLRKGITVTHQLEIRMPDNYVLFYKVPPKDEQMRMLNEADNYIERIPGLLAENAHKEKRSLIAPAVSAIGYPWYKYGRRTKRFRVTDECTGCSVCEAACQMNIIKMKDGRPHWTENRCERCLACVHRCPGAAIQIGRSLKHGRYLNPNIEQWQRGSL